MTGAPGGSQHENHIWDELGKIYDPEIPVLSLVEMKVIREVRLGDPVTVVISPTFVGCPAMSTMMEEIRLRMKGLGYETVRIETTFSPPWSTDLLDESVREKLRAFGLAPPPPVGHHHSAGNEHNVSCPHCGSDRTAMESAFGSTLCRQIFYCSSCRQSFERFKQI